MANIKTINGNPIVVGTSGIEDAAVTMAKLSGDVQIPQPTDAQVTSAVSTWLTAHPEATTTVQDGSITDAKLIQSGGVLSKVAGIANAMDNGVCSAIDVLSQSIAGWIRTNVAIGSTVSTARTQDSAWKTCIVRVFKGDYFIISGQGGDGARLWALTDANFSLLAIATANEVAAAKQIDVHSDGYAIINVRVASSPDVKYYDSNIRTSVDDLRASIAPLVDITDEMVVGIHTTNVDYGAVVGTNITANNAWRTLLMQVSAGDYVIITGKGGSGSLLWAMTDNSYHLLEKSWTNTTETSVRHDIRTSGYLIINCDANQAHKVEYCGATAAVQDAMERLSDVEDGKLDNVVEIKNWLYGYVKCPGIVGERLDTSYVYSATYRTQAVHVVAGERYRVTGGSYGSARAYCLLNSDFETVEVAAAGASVTDYELDITNDGLLIVNVAPAKGDYRLEKFLPLSGTDESTFVAPTIPSTFETIASVQYNAQSKMSYEQIIAGYDALVTAHPNNVTKTALGLDSSGENTVYKYVFTPSIATREGYQQGMGATVTDDAFPTVYMDAGIHGSEWPCMWALLNLMTAIYTAEDGLLGWMKSNIKFIIIPVVCPYGYVNNSYTNANGVNLNRNFNMFFGESPTEESGASPLNQPESQYVDAILRSLIGKRAFYYSWHTHGVFTDFAHITCYAYPLTGDTHKHALLANELINAITDSGHKNHELPADSGLIGISQIANQVGMAAYQATAYGIPAATPEVMYRYYDGQLGADHSEKIKCMNVEYMIAAVALAYRDYLAGN